MSYIKTVKKYELRLFREQYLLEIDHILRKTIKTKSSKYKPRLDLAIITILIPLYKNITY